MKYYLWAAMLLVSFGAGCDQTGTTAPAKSVTKSLADPATTPEIEHSGEQTNTTDNRSTNSERETAELEVAASDSLAEPAINQPDLKQDSVAVPAQSRPESVSSPIASGESPLVDGHSAEPESVPSGTDETDQDEEVDTAQELIDQGLIDKEWIRLHPQFDLWLDKENSRVIVGGRICFREGFLEMFACPRHSKEHESIVAVNAPARLIHATFLALGIEPGHPVEWTEDSYKPVEGPVVKVEVRWKDNGKLVTRRAQEMIRDAATGEPMKQEWIFGGSKVFEDDLSGKSFYAGDGGEFICVSNFETATMDIPVMSAADNSALNFTAITENIPELDHRILLVLTPVKSANNKSATENADKKNTEPDVPKTDSDAQTGSGG